VKSIISVFIVFPVIYFTEDALSQKMGGRYGISLQTGILIADNLYIYDPLYSHVYGSQPHREESVGFPLSGGFYYFIKETIMVGTNVVFTWIPGVAFAGPKNSWSLLEFDAHAGYLNRPASKTRFYGKLGFKLARLKGSERPGKSLLGGTVGHHIDSKTSYEPGGEIALGLMRIHEDAAFFVEASFSRIFARKADVTAYYSSGGTEATPGKYAYDLDFYGVRIGVMYYFGP
jgi:hypothetical protein